MATYFDPTNAADLKLLRSAFRDVAEILEIAAGAEADVIRMYTGRLYPWSAGKVMVGPPTSIGGNPERFVYLWGYTVDSAAASADFLDALKRTVAHVVDWRIGVSKRDPSMGAGQTKTIRSLAGDANTEFPRGWNWRLHEYDVRPDSTIWIA
jgi:hypothetical protein